MAISPSEDRERYTKAILESPADKKLIVAGPGTGKTFVFKQALSASGGRGLALTFINNLVRDLKVELADIADAHTFHGFCKYLLHRADVDGLTPSFDYYPSLQEIVAHDLRLLGRADVDPKDIESSLHNLDDTQGIISEALKVGNYYNAVSYTDSVYRMLRHLESHPTEVPEYPLIVVDEYQDFSLLESTFIRVLSTRSHVLIAGDDDQALYGFKHASASYIRALAQDPEYTRFDLPYCSRCTEVIVNAVQDVLSTARSLGLLDGRLDKPYTCYTPDKQADSQQYPHIVRIHCTVERKNAPYIGRYVADRIAKIPEADIRASHEGKYPTALVIGPMEFVRRVYPELKGRFQDVVLKESSQLQVQLLDAYRYLCLDEESRLGWRILLYCDPPEGVEAIISAALSDSTPLASLLPIDYKARHTGVVRLLNKIRANEPLTGGDQAIVESATDLSIDELRPSLGLENQSEEEESTTLSDQQAAGETSQPKIVCTSLLGAKGLSAGHVFIVGVNNGHFPRNPAAITDDEVCCLLVGLSRTIKQWYLVSCGRFGNVTLKPSVLLEWVQTRLQSEIVDSKYIKSLSN